MILLKLPENPHALMKQTYVPPLGLWSMRENSSEPIHVIDAHLLGGEEADRQISKLEGERTLGISAQFSTQDEALREAIEKYRDRFRIIVGGPYGSTTRYKGTLSVPGWGERYLNLKIITFSDVKPPLFTEKEILPYWMLRAPHGLHHVPDRWMNIETSRGCVFECGFCDMPRFWGRWDVRPLDQLKEYFSWLKTSLGIEELFIEDDNVNLSKDRFIDIIGLLKDLNLWWSCPNGIYARNLLDSKVLHALEKSTCWGLSLPFETGSLGTSGLMKLGKKWLNPREAELLVLDLRVMGISTTGFFIIGYPGENEDDVKKTLDFANSLDLDEKYIYLAAPYPGTEIYETCKRNGWLLEGTPTYRTAIINTPFLDADRLIQLFSEDRAGALRRKNHEA